MKVLATQAFIDLMNNPHARGVQFIAVEHDEGCPMSSHSGSYGECTCDEVNIRLSTEDEFGQSMERSRQVRRKARRDAEKAMRKARQGGAA